jgi:nucleoside triphosphate pyrophosphatase
MTLWRAEKPLVLASQSRARRTLLANAGLSFESDPPNIDERAIQATSGLTEPGKIAALLAREKALAISTRRPDRYVLAADQTLALGKRIFTKPANPAQAAEQLRAFSGQCHELHSAIAVAREGGILFEHVAVARMTMRRLSDADIEAYLEEAGSTITSSVGAYQLEGLGVHLFEAIDGDHFTVLGLPLLPLLAFLRAAHLLGL